MIKLKRTFKKETRKEHVLIRHVLLISFFQISLLQGYGRTLLHQRRSEAAVRTCFTKLVSLKILQNSQENTCAGVTF